MSMIDYGALLKVDNIFVNKNKDLFMKCSDTGYMCEYAKESLRLIYIEKEKMNTKEENGTKK